MISTSKVRCAIYTRKSSEEGLDQDFNSIEAQREAGEAYVRSQAHEGWTLLPQRYDDGGFSGGNMDRPALVRLMDAVRSGEIDVIVIYKIDRLTRSLTDFARLAETFDQHKVSFVSVTQQFNTTNSMGRLMLNVLLSFAQFEREITGERIRDKFAASKKKGMWMGGMAPMGYSVRDRRLIVDETEAESVRKVFDTYLELGDVPSVLERLKQDGVVTAPRTSAKGRQSGERPFTRGHVYKLLSNPIYIGQVRHKGVPYPGQHEPIITRAVWTRVQAQLAANTQGPRKRRRRAEVPQPLLEGLLFASDGSRFTPTHANKGSRRYSYYVEETNSGATPRRLPATEIEKAVVGALVGYLGDQRQLVRDLGVNGAALSELLSTAISVAERIKSRQGIAVARKILNKVMYRDERLELQIKLSNLQSLLGHRDHQPGDGTENMQAADDLILVRVPLMLRHRGRQLKLVVQSSDPAPASPDRSMLNAVVRARDWSARIIAGASMTQIAEEEQVTDGYVGQLLPLAFLAPPLIGKILSGQTPPELSADRLIWKVDLPMSWSEQTQQLAG